jgi:hypothetical protein
MGNSAARTVVPPEPWARLPGESERAYASFCTYRDVPVKVRRIGKLLVEGKFASDSWNTVRKWRKQFAWDERAALYADERDRVAREAMKREERAKLELQLKDVASRHAKTAQVYGSMLVKLHEAFFRRLKSDEKNLDELPMPDLLRYLIRAAGVLPDIQEAERVALGIHPVLNVVHRLDPHKVAQMSDEELLQAYEELQSA